ncbi:MAG: LysE family translocator [Ardenticatenales bacterium]|nr:LysE family translocator [Ardenticatenales bacterium]
MPLESGFVRWLPPGPVLSAFLLASLVLAVTPGPAVVFIVSRSLLQGRRVGLASVAGIALGNLGNMLGASIGLAALFAASSAAFTIVKYAGALYLVYVGVQTIRGAPDEAADASPASPASTSSSAPPPDVRRVVGDAFVVALFNPKTALFFAAFLPQFMRADVPALPQSIALGALFIAIAAGTDSAYAIAAGTLGPALARGGGRRARAAGRWVAGGAFIGLGVFTAVMGGRG